MPSTEDVRSASERYRRPSVVLAPLLLAIVLSPPALIATAFWAASAPWEFSQEGTDPGAVTATYDSKALPADVIAAYAQRCRTMGLEIKKQTAAREAIKSTLVCEGRQDVYASDDVWVIAERAQGDATTVLVTAGPGLTATYNF